MIAYVIVALVSGILFGVLDALINANPVARRLHDFYRPLAKSSANVPAGVLIDIAYGFILAAIFVVLYESLPGEAGIVKGLAFAVLAWFFRVVMSAASNWMMLQVPGRALAYQLAAGLGEMVVLGAIFGSFLEPW